MASKFTSLNTYKRRLDGKAIATVDGDHKTIKIETAWLRREIAPQTLDEFLAEYTFDESEYFYNQYLGEKGGQRKKVNDFLDALETLSAQHNIWLEKEEGTGLTLYNHDYGDIGICRGFNYETQIYEAEFREVCPECGKPEHYEEEGARHS